MKLSELTAASLIEFYIGGCSFLAANKEIVNALNVFPVPDGDTGTNMSLTMNSAVKELSGLDSVTKVANAVSTGSLMGARGNSGVILSQLFRGFAQGVGEKKTLFANDFAFALQRGVDLAYKSVMKPVEGTILTVSKAVANAAIKQARQNKDIIEVLSYALLQGQVALNNTPNQLAVLKQAGVVDAGGKGFLFIIEGGLKALQGEKINDIQVSVSKDIREEQKSSDSQQIAFQYCTEFIIKGDKLSSELIREKIRNKGDSLLVVGADGLIKVHIHTNHPGEILEYAVAMGTIHDIKIDNMKDQHQDYPPLAEPEPDDVNCAVVTVAAGDGLAEIFTSLGADRVINGGQTMNPSAEDLVNAIKDVSAREVIILPNNSNIILTAKQAQSLSHKPVQVVPTKFFVQGLAAMLAFEKDETSGKNAEKMAKAFTHVKAGEVTYAVRNSSYDNMVINEGDILGLTNGSIKVIGQDINKVVLDLLLELVDEENELITLFYGKDVSKDSTQELSEKIKTNFPDLDVDIHFGGQPLYYYLISVE